ncbi:TlpA family protein disulfide reductase [Candidatus Woesearchaeota archaeon]|nr:TlpA family protein disulfide reductase [Candidatus Woesearchaeota archaeon]
MRLLLIAFLLLLVACATNANLGDDETGALAETGSQKGNLAPGFVITDINGKTVSLDASKPALVYFWTTWCPACQHDLGVLKEVHPEFNDIPVIAINMDLNEDDAKIRAYVKDNPDPTLIFANGPEPLLRDYDIIYTSTKVPVGKDGIILWRGSGEASAEVFRTIFEGLQNS